MTTKAMFIERPGCGLAAYLINSARQELPWLVLSNSLGATTAMWQPQLKALKRRFRIACYDTRGHGHSRITDATFGGRDLTDDLLAVMDAFGVEQAHLLGLSLGGATALQIALDHPDRVLSVVCCSSRIHCPTPLSAVWDERIDIVQHRGTASLWDQTLDRWLTAETIVLQPGMIERLGAAFCSTSSEGYIGCVKCLKGTDLRSRLQNLDVPSLFVSGSLDHAAPPEVVRQAAAITPAGRYVEIPKAAHLVNIDQPKIFLQALTEFWEKLEDSEKDRKERRPSE
jgi:3-oxoadipate enol-lactonase